METLLPQVRVDISAPALAIPPRCFPGGPDDLRLEIGFGGGEHLAAERSGASRARLFLAANLSSTGSPSCWPEIETRGLTNIRIHPGDAGDLIDALPAASLSGVCLLYPDPWPKRRHHERRFVSDAMLGAAGAGHAAGRGIAIRHRYRRLRRLDLARILRSPDFLWPARHKGGMADALAAAGPARATRPRRCARDVVRSI